jgi:hypothetical protein
MLHRYPQQLYVCCRCLGLYGAPPCRGPVTRC